MHETKCAMCDSEMTVESIPPFVDSADDIDTTCDDCSDGLSKGTPNDGKAPRDRDLNDLN